MRIWTFFVILILLQFSFIQNSRAEFARSKFLENLGKQQNNKYQDRWTIADWFETQRQVRLLDQWLALNSSSNPFEFYLGADYGELERTNTDSSVVGTPDTHNMYRGTFGAFATIVGLQAQYAVSDEEYELLEGTFNLRILGRAQQATNWTLFYGYSQRTEKDKINTPVVEETFKNTFGGASFSIYFTKYFGVEGLYKTYFKKKSDRDTEMEGQRAEGTVFIDFSFLRIYGTYYEEKLEFTNPTLTIDREAERKGILGGLRFFF